MFLALAHMVGATQVMGLGWGGVGMITFFELADMVTWPVPCCISNFLFFFGKSDIWNMCLFWVQNRSSILFRYAMEDLLRALAILILLRCGNGFLLPKIQHSWFLKNRDSKKQTQKAWLSDIAIFFHVQIHCACQWIMTLPPKILWPTALLNTWNIITFPKSSFYHTNHTFLTNINVWMMDFWSINTRIKKISSAQNTILCREWLLQKLTFRHSEITIFNHSQNPTQRTFGEPPAPSVYIYICIQYLHKHVFAWTRLPCHLLCHVWFLPCPRNLAGHLPTILAAAEMAPAQASELAQQLAKWNSAPQEPWPSQKLLLDLLL